MTDQPSTPVDPQLLEILVCPMTKGPLRYDRERGELVSEQAGLAYPVRDGIPIMLPDQARKLIDAPPVTDAALRSARTASTSPPTLCSRFSPAASTFASKPFRRGAGHGRDRR
jgi:uncharacterized protein YbaR (Trm112 family)